jgi:hypothetical protein
METKHCSIDQFWAEPVPRTGRFSPNAWIMIWLLVQLSPNKWLQ